MTCKMDSVLVSAISSLLLEENELSLPGDISLIERKDMVCSNEQGGDKTEEIETNPNNGGNKLSQDDSVLGLDAGLFDMQANTDQRPIYGTESAITPSLLPYGILEKFVVEPADAELTPEVPITSQMVPESFAPCEAGLGPVISPQLIHSPPGLPCDVTEGIPLDLEISVSPKHSPPAKDLSTLSSQAKETALTPVNMPEFAPTFLLPISDMSENTDLNILIPDKLISFQVPSVQPHKSFFEHLQTPHLMPEYPVQPQQQSELAEWLKKNDLEPVSEAELPQCFPLPSFEATEKTTMLLMNDKLLPGQNVDFQMQLGLPELLHEPELKSVEVPQLQSTLIQSPSLGAGQGTDIAFIEEQELALLRVCPQDQHQASCSTKNPQPQPFHWPSLLGYGPPRYSNHIQPNKLVSGPCLPQMPAVYADHKQPGHPLIYTCYQPSLQPSYCLASPFTPDVRFNPTPVTFDNCPPVRSQLNFNSIPSVPSHLNPNCSPLLLHMYPPLPVNISGQSINPNAQGLSQKLYENYRLWQEYCKVARSVYTSSPDLEALACFFIPIIRSLSFHRPDLPFPTAVRKAVLEWEKHSNFDRMNYYHMAQMFMEFEKKELKSIKAEKEPRASQELALKRGSSIQTNEQPEQFKGNVLMQSTYKVSGQAVNRNIQDLAEKALREYSEIMNDLESKIKGGSENAKEAEEMDDEVAEGPFIEYLDELCSQKKFVTEVGAEIDMAYVSSLLSSDSNTTDILVQPETLDNTQDVLTGITLEPVAYSSGNQSTAEYISAAPPILHFPPQTCDTQSTPPLQYGLCMADGTVNPLPPSFNIHFPNQPEYNPWEPLPDKYLAPPQMDTAWQSGLLPFQKTFQTFPPPLGPLPHLRMAPLYRNAPQWLKFVPEIPSFVPVLVQETESSSYTQQLALSIESSKEDVVAEIKPTFMDKNDNSYAPPSSPVRPTITDSITKEKITASVSKSSDQKMEPLHSIVINSIFQDYSQSTHHTDINIEKETWTRHKKHKCNNLVIPPTINCAATESSFSATTSDGYKQNIVKNKNKCAVGTQKIKKSKPDEQGGNGGEAAIEQLCSPAHKEHSNYSIECQAEQLDNVSELTEDEMAVAQILALFPSSLDSPTSTWPQSILRPCTPTFTHIDKRTSPENLETCPIEAKVVKDEAHSRNSSRSPPSLAPVSLKDLSIFTPGTSKLIKMEGEGSKSDNCPENTKCSIESYMDRTNEDKTKSLEDSIEALFQTIVDQFNGVTQEMSQSQCIYSKETEDLSKMSGQKGAVTGSSTQVNNPQYFHVPSKSYTDIDFLVPQNDAAIVTQREFTKYDPVTNDQSNETSDPIARAYNMQEKSETQDLVNMLTHSTDAPLSPTGLVSFMSDCVDSDMPSELPTFGLESLVDIVQGLSTHLLLSPGEVVVEIPQENMDGGFKRKSSPENTLPSGTEMATATKKVVETDAETMKETDEQKDREYTSTVEDSVTEEYFDKSRENETTNVSKMSHAESPGPVEKEKVAAEMTTETSEYNIRLAEGNGSVGEKITAEDSLSTSEGKLSQDQNTGASQHKQDKCSTMKSKSLVNQDGHSSGGENENKEELTSIKHIQTKTKEFLNQSDRHSPKNKRPNGRKMDKVKYEILKKSANIQGQMMEKKLEIENISKKETDALKEHSHKSIGRVTRQSLKRAEIEVAQRRDDQKNKVMRRSSRSCKAVKVASDLSNENQKRRINTAERQTQRKSVGVSKEEPKNDTLVNSTFVIDTRRTRSFNSLASEEAAGTQNVKIKTENSNAGMDAETRQPQVEGEKKSKAPEIKRSTKSEVLSGRRRTRNFDTALVKDVESEQIHMDQENPNVLVSSKDNGKNVDISTRRRSFSAKQGSSVATSERPMGDREEGTETMACSSERTTRGNLIIGPVKTSIINIPRVSSEGARGCGPGVEKAAEKLAKIKDEELSSDTSKRHDSPRSNSLVPGFIFTMHKLKETPENEPQNGTKEPKYKQSKAKNQVRDKRTEGRQTRSYMTSLQLQVENKNAMKASDGSSRSKTGTNQKMSGVQKGVEERQQRKKRVEQKKVKEEGSNKKDAERSKITRGTRAVSTQAETGEQDMTTGTVITRRRRMILEQMERQRSRAIKKTEDSAIRLAHGWRETEDHQRDRKYMGLNTKAHNRTFRKREKSFVLVTPQIRRRSERRNDGPKEMEETQTRSKTTRGVKSTDSKNSHPVKMQTLAGKVKQGVKDSRKNWSQTATTFTKLQNQTSCSAEAKDTPSSSKVQRRAKTGPPVTPVALRKRREEKRSQSEPVLCKKMEGKENEGKERKKKPSHATTRGENAGKTDIRMKSNKSKSKSDKKGSDRLGKMQRKRTR